MGSFKRVSTTAERLRIAMESAGMRQSDLAKAADIDKSALSRYLKGSYEPKQFFINKLAKALNVSEMWLWGYDCPRERSNFPPHPDIHPITRTWKLPLLGPVAAGQPISTAPEDGETIELPYDPGKADAALTVKGDSMTPRYLDGDVVLIRYQDDVDDGQIAAICIDDTVTLKKVYHIPNGVYLVSENPTHPPMTFTMEDANNIHIAGLVVGFMRWEY